MEHMKKIGVTFLAACLGGAVAIGSYKFIENRYGDGMSFEDKQKVYFTNNPGATINSSTGALDFTQAAATVTPAVVHIKTTYNVNANGGYLVVIRCRICLKISLVVAVGSRALLRDQAQV
jgi:serine protease Do